MRRWLSIAKATALEILSEPLSFLLMLTAVTMTSLASVFHYHQFGEATRMARDAGLSFLFLAGTLTAIAGPLKSFRREIETGTIQMALVHPLSRTTFFLAKCLGAAAAYFVFALIVAANTLIIVRGAEIGGSMAERTGDIARLWRPSFALSMATAVVPLVAAAALDRFARWRFVPTAFVLATVISLGGTVYRFNGALLARLAPVLVLATFPAILFLVISSALAVKFKANAAMSIIAVLFIAFVPAVGNYYLPDALSKGGCLSWSYVALAALALLPAIVAALFVGIRFIRNQDIT